MKENDKKHRKVGVFYSYKRKVGGEREKCVIYLGVLLVGLV